MLVQMCIFRGHIPTGAPTSSILAFLSHKDLFDEIAEYMTQRDITFTLYVDDITLSAKHGITREEIKFIKSVLKKHKLEIKPEKTKFFSYKKAMITGFYLAQGGKIRVPDSVGYKIVSLLREKKLEEMNKKELRRVIGLINYCQTADKHSFSATKRNAIQALKRLDKKEKEETMKKVTESSNENNLKGNVKIHRIDNRLDHPSIQIAKETLSNLSCEEAGMLVKLLSLPDNDGVLQMAWLEKECKISKLKRLKIKANLVKKGFIKEIQYRDTQAKFSYKYEIFEQSFLENEGGNKLNEQ